MASGGIIITVISYMRSFIHSLVHRPAELLFCNRYRAQYGGVRKKDIRSSPALGSEKDPCGYDVSRVGECQRGEPKEGSKL